MLKIAFLCLPEVFCDQKVYEKCIFDTPPSLHPIQCLWRLHIASQRLGHFDSRAFGSARHLCPPPAQAWLLSAALGLARAVLIIQMHSAARVPPPHTITTRAHSTII